MELAGLWGFLLAYFGKSQKALLPSVFCLPVCKFGKRKMWGGRYWLLLKHSQMCPFWDVPRLLKILELLRVPLRSVKRHRYSPHLCDQFMTFLTWFSHISGWSPSSHGREMCTGSSRRLCTMHVHAICETGNPQEGLSHMSLPFEKQEGTHESGFYMHGLKEQLSYVLCNIDWILRCIGYSRIAKQFCSTSTLKGSLAC